MVPKPLMYLALFFVVLALMPPALIAWARATNSRKTRVHLVQDMDNQAKFRAQHPSAMFEDGRAMRPNVEGTISRETTLTDSHYDDGVVNGEWATGFPIHIDGIELDREFIERGRERFEIFCTPCHGQGGYGDGIVHLRATLLVDAGTNGSTWVAPKSIHEAAISEQPVGKIFNTITQGVRNMPSYATQVPTRDRWAIVAYVKVLQRSQNARIQDVPAELRPDLPLIKLPPEPVAEEGPS